MEVFYCFTVAIGLPGDACITQWLSIEAKVRARSEILAIWVALKQMSENKNDGFTATYEHKKLTCCFPFVNMATIHDRTEQSFSGEIFELCTDESFRRTMHQ